jgi:hypothetical protein
VKRARLPPLTTREVVPRSRFPNFRDHGRMVDRPLLAVLASLMKKHGEAFASEAGLRRMICEDTGHMPGVDTIPTALERLEETGVLTQRWLKPGGLLPDGRPCTYGTRLVYLPQCRPHRRALASKRNRREGVTGRPDRRALDTLQAARASIGKAVAPIAERDGGLDRRRDAELARLRDLEAQWAAAAPVDPDKPPD